MQETLILLTTGRQTHFSWPDSKTGGGHRRKTAFSFNIIQTIPSFNNQAALFLENSPLTVGIFMY